MQNTCAARWTNTLVAVVALCGALEAQNLTTVRIASGLQKPDYVGAPPSDRHRLFVLEQKVGYIRLIKDGTLLSTPFLNLHSLVQSTGGERGLLGLAFHPNYASNGYFYVAYTDTNGQPMLVRYKRSSNPDLADPASATTIIGPIPHPQDNHNAGALAFGPDGYLYYGMGDGGGADDAGPGHAPGGNAQSGGTLLGKIMRFDVDAPFPHIPPSNPFVSNPNFRDEIWSYGFRNPFRLSFDRVTGDMWIGDVGQDAWEEIDFEPAGSAGGLNYGWRCMEANHCTSLSGCSCSSPSLVAPVEEYPHTTGCAVIGGVIYRGCDIPALNGHYFYGDHCSGRIWSFFYDSATGTKGPTIERTAQLAPGGGLVITRIGSFGEDSSGEIYLCDWWDGEIYKIVSSDPNTTTYCTAKQNSLGCLPAISSTGTASASATSGFVVKASNIRNRKNGLLFYGVSGRASSPFQGGTLCIATPIARTPGMYSGGSAAPVNDCTGSFSIDMNRFAQGLLGGNPLPALQQAGTLVDCQWWGRDPGFAPPNNTQLSNALEYVPCP
jgi:glucose/arabinose dehydrogenase